MPIIAQPHITADSVHTTVVGDENITNLIYQNFVTRNLIIDCNHSFFQEYVISKKNNMYTEFIDEIPFISWFQNEIFAEFQTTLAINFRKLELVAKSFKKTWSKRSLCCGVAITMIGCYLDNLIDYGNNESRSEALQILDWDNGCGKFFTCKEYRNDKPIQAILSEVGLFLQEIKKTHQKTYQSLLSDLHRLSIAEIYAATPLNNIKDLQYAINKSVLFVLTEFRLASAGNLSLKEERLCRIIGEAMCLIDDISDLEEDIKLNQINSILCLVRNRNEIVDVINKSFLKLDTLLCQLRSGLSPECYEFLFNELKLWTLGNEHIRNKVMRR